MYPTAPSWNSKFRVYNPMLLFTWYILLQLDMLLVSNLGIRYSYGSLSTLKSLFFAIEKERKYIKVLIFFLILRNQEKTQSCPARKSAVLQSATSGPPCVLNTKTLGWKIKYIYLQWWEWEQGGCCRLQQFHSPLLEPTGLESSQLRILATFYMGAYGSAVELGYWIHVVYSHIHVLDHLLVLQAVLRISPGRNGWERTVSV